MTGPTLFDTLLPAPGDLKDQALDEVEEHAASTWKSDALAAVRALARALPEFSADEVWHRLAVMDSHTYEPRALGSIMREAARRGWITSSGRYRPSTRHECKARPVMVWLSLIQEGDDR